MPLRVNLRVVMIENAKGEKIESIESIRRPEDEMCYIFPPEYQERKYHQQLFSLPTVKKTANSLTKVGQYRNIKITIDDETAALYTDTDSNFVFRDIVLEEAEITYTRKTKTEIEKPNLDMERLLEALQRRDKREIEEINFNIERFEGTQKAANWIAEYEEECKKYKIKSDEEKIKGLRKYLGKTAEKWYQTNLLKAEEHNWEDWKEAFLKTFKNKGWSAIRYAYNFKYLSGSLVEYAIEKERLILEVKRKMDEEVRIHLIVIGLPIEVQDKIESDNIQTKNDLIGIYLNILCKRWTTLCFVKLTGYTKSPLSRKGMWPVSKYVLLDMTIRQYL